MTYEYQCKVCGGKFDVDASVAEKEAGLHPDCPSCGSKRAAQVFGAVNILTTEEMRSGGKRGRMQGCGPDGCTGCC